MPPLSLKPQMIGARLLSRSNVLPLSSFWFLISLISPRGFCMLLHHVHICWRKCSEDHIFLLDGAYPLAFEVISFTSSSVTTFFRRIAWLILLFLIKAHYFFRGWIFFFHFPEYLYHSTNFSTKLSKVMTLSFTLAFRDLR